MFKLFGYIIMTPTERNVLENNAYVHGYEIGVECGRKEAIFSKFTADEIRKVFGFEPLKGE